VDLPSKGSKYVASPVLRLRFASVHMDCSSVLQLVRLQAQTLVIAPGTFWTDLSGSMVSSTMKRKRLSLPAFERLRKTFPNGRDCDGV
jgi:hypothetical protein